MKHELFFTLLNRIYLKCTAYVTSRGTFRHPATLLSNIIIDKIKETRSTGVFSGK